MNQNIQLISAPSILGLKPHGVELLADTLLKNGLAAALNITTSPIVIPVLNNTYSAIRDTETNCLNTKAVIDFSETLMNAVASQLENGLFPLVLGGDCSILIGIMPGLKTTGRFGLIFLDAHADFYEPEKSTTGELADMDLAIITGRGPETLTDIHHLRPYVDDKNVIHIGQRDAAETKQYGSQDIRDSGITVFDLEEIQAIGIDQLMMNVKTKLKEINTDRYWIHFDTDVISDKENPAVDYRLPGGLSFKETTEILHSLLQTDKIAGMSVTIFNPNLDKNGEVAGKIVDCLRLAFSD